MAPTPGFKRRKLRESDPEIMYEGLNIACHGCCKLAVNAVHMPCCKEIICENCLASLEDTCPSPNCKRQQVDFSKCRPNKLIRMAVGKFLKEDMTLHIAVERQAYSVDLCPLMERNLTLLRSGECSDLTVRCGSHEYRLHRAMVCAQSNFLTLCCDGRFKEGVTGKVDLPDDDPATFARLVSFLYTMKYDDGASTAIAAATRAWVPSIGEGHLWQSTGETPLYKTTTNALVYAMADKYDVPGLCELAEVKFKASIAWCSPSDLPDMVETVLTTAPPWSGLYDALVDICGANLDALMKDEYFLRVLNNHTEFGNELFQKHHTRLLIRSRLERVDLETEKEDHARTKARLREAEKILIQNDLYDVRVGLRWCPLPLTKQLSAAARHT